MIEIKDLAGVSQPLSKLIDSCSVGLGKLYEPTHIKRIAKAKAKEIEIISKALSENISMPVNYENGSLSINNENIEGLISRANHRQLFQEAQKQQNIELVISNAYAELENEEEVSDEPVDKDWILRFFNSVEDISNEEMQKIWGKILAGEIKKPKSVSLRTLETLKNLSAEEAKSFEDISKFAIPVGLDEYLILNTRGYWDKRCNFKELLVLEESGLLNTRASLKYNYKVNIEKYIFTKNDKLLLTLKANQENEQININVMKFTKTGVELSKINNFIPDNESIIDFAKILKKEQTHINVSVYEIIEEKEDGSIDYNEDKDLLLE